MAPRLEGARHEHVRWTKPLATAKSAQGTADAESHGVPPGSSAAVARPRRAFGAWSDKWREMPRTRQWLVLLPVVVLAFLLPVMNIPFITTEPGNDWPLACQAMAIFALVAVGLNIVIGYAGLLDLGYIAFFAVGSYTAAMLTSPDSAFIKIPYLWQPSRWPSRCPCLWASCWACPRCVCAATTWPS
ncbi:ABC transporter permease subunit [Arthrobacter psychrolactophilus]